MRLWQKTSITRAFLILVFLSALASAGHFPENIKHSINRITGHIYNDQFDDAGRLIDSLEYSNPRSALVPLFRAILYQARMMTEESDFLENQFYKALDTADIRSRRILESGGDSALAYYFLGQTEALRSLYNARAGKTWAAIKGGLRARNAYGRGYKIDPSFHDIALGLGSYRYWKTVKTKLLNWTPLFKREKDDGIDLLRLAVDSSEISSDAARTSLIWIYMNEKLYGEAIRLTDLMHRKYPHGLTFYWAMGEASFKMGDHRLAIRSYQDILERLNENPGNYYNIIEAAYFINICYRELADKYPHYSDSLIILQKYLNDLPIPGKTASRQKKKLKKILKPLRR